MQFELAPFALPEGYAEGVLSLADAKVHVGELTNDRDVLIGFCRDAAIDMVERFCGVRLATCEGVIWQGEALAARIELGVWPVQAVTAVSWLDSSGEEVTGNAADWRVLRRGTIALKPGRQLPSGVAGGVAITFTAGFTDATRPAVLVQAARMFLTHLVENREAVATGVAAGEVPLGFRDLCNRVRMPSI